MNLPHGTRVDTEPSLFSSREIIQDTDFLGWLVGRKNSSAAVRDLTQMARVLIEHASVSLTFVRG